MRVILFLVRAYLRSVCLELFIDAFEILLGAKSGFRKMIQ
jgi:hypothetical protein